VWRGERGKQWHAAEGHRLESSPWPPCRGHCLCTWDAQSTHWGTGFPSKRSFWSTIQTLLLWSQLRRPSLSSLWFNLRPSLFPPLHPPLCPLHPHRGHCVSPLLTHHMSWLVSVSEQTACMYSVYQAKDQQSPHGCPLFRRLLTQRQRHNWWVRLREAWIQ